MNESASLTQEFQRAVTAIRKYALVMRALIWREAEERRQSPVDSLLELLEPVLLIAVMTVAWWFLMRRTSAPLGGPPLLFYATGFFALYFFVHVSNKMRRFTVGANRRFPIEERLDHIIVHLIFKAIEYSILGVLLFSAIYAFVTPQAIPHNFSAVIGACLALIAIGFGWGVLNLVLSRLWTPWGHTRQAVNRALILFSGVLFIIDFLPPGTRHILGYLPHAHAIALFRTGFYPSYPHLFLDTSYLFVCALAAVAGGLVLERATRRFE